MHGGKAPSPITAGGRIDPITASILQGALENIAIEMGYKLMRMSYSSIIRESEDFGAAICDATGRQLCECSKSTPLQSGPIPGYVRGHHPRVRGARRRVSPRRRDHPQRPVQRRLARARYRLLRTDLSRRPADRLLDDDRAPPRHRLEPARQRRRRGVAAVCRGTAVPRHSRSTTAGRATRRSGA